MKREGDGRQGETETEGEKEETEHFVSLPEEGLFTLWLIFIVHHIRFYGTFSMQANSSERKNMNPKKKWTKLDVMQMNSFELQIALRSC